MEGVRPIGGMSVDSCFISHSGSSCSLPLEDLISLLEDCPENELANRLEATLLRIEIELVDRLKATLPRGIEQEEAWDELWNRVFSSLSKRFCEVPHDRIASSSLFGVTIKTVLAHLNRYPHDGLRKSMGTFVDGLFR